MTDQLTSLLRREAERVPVPSAPAYEIVRRGRRTRRNRRASSVAAVTVLLVAGMACFAALRPESRTGLEPAHSVLGGTEPTFVAHHIYLDQHTHVTLPAQPTYLLYTSAGLVVPTTSDPHERPPYRLTVLDAAGRTRELSVSVPGWVIASDQEAPYVAWVDHDSSGTHLVVHDVTTDRDVAEVPVSGPYPMPVRQQLRVWLDGDTAYLAADGGGYAVDWRTGDVTDRPDLDHLAVGGVHGEHLLDLRAHRVVDLRTGKVLLHFPARANAQLSPDGQELEVSPWNSGVEYLYDVANGRKVMLTGRDGFWGWTPQGRPMGLVQENGTQEARLSGQQLLVVCSPTDGRCSGTPFDHARHLQQTTHQNGFSTGLGGIW